jgi:hypothetical protein
MDDIRSMIGRGFVEPDSASETVALLLMEVLG